MAASSYNGVKVDTEGLKRFAKEMRAASPKLGSAVNAELKEVGNLVRDHIRQSTAPPFAGNPGSDSKGIIGRKRRSVKTGIRAGTVTLYSLEPDAAVFQWGGSISPRGVPISIPRTEFVTKQVEKDTPEIEARMATVLEGVAERYAGFS
jgi:hypothetical protein